ncbi:hypothetical protein [Schaalia canis]|uniref:hypothetical protein n=1 Tax=Schaalia canis TaxID=100469 RepID=UPI00196B2F35|nr:hypothetical protein [Schaalia canis]
MPVDVRQSLEWALPVLVEEFVLVSDTIPNMRAGEVTLAIWGHFVGQCAGECIWDDLDPAVLTDRLHRFVGQHLVAVEGGRGWLHLAFTDGWIRVVADRGDWEGWVVSLPGVSWVGGWDSDALGSSRVVGRKESPKASLRKPSA